MDHLEAMEDFVASVEPGSFSAAGHRLDVPLPTVGRKVADLEGHLNTRLLVRSTRKLALTGARNVKDPGRFGKHMGVTYIALASGMIGIFNPRGGKPSRAVRPWCRLKINTAEAAIDAAIAGIGVTNVLSYQVVKPISDGTLSSFSKILSPNQPRSIFFMPGRRSCHRKYASSSISPFCICASPWTRTSQS
jgi:DNA-binding transcriptional LysR family regulator